jgi:hypothetical protein
MIRTFCTAMIRTFCTFLVLACVAGLSGVLIGHVWNRYADQNGLLGVSGIYERILAARASFVSAPRDHSVRKASAFEE